MPPNARKKVMTFGVFDRLHPGHIAFLKQAAQLGDELIVVVARDLSVFELKKKMPAQSEKIRMKHVANVKEVTGIALGDHQLGSWDVIKTHKPDIICVGYDQEWLKKNLQDQISKGFLPYTIQLSMAQAHKPQHFHTSLLIENDVYRRNDIGCELQNSPSVIPAYAACLPAGRESRFIRKQREFRSRIRCGMTKERVNFVIQ